MTRNFLPCLSTFFVICVAVIHNYGATFSIKEDGNIEECFKQLKILHKETPVETLTIAYRKSEKKTRNSSDEDGDSRNSSDEDGDSRNSSDEGGSSEDEIDNLGQVVGWFGTQGSARNLSLCSNPLPNIFLTNLTGKNLTSLDLEGSEFSTESQNKFPDLVASMPHLVTLNLKSVNFVGFEKLSILSALLERDKVNTDTFIENFFHETKGIQRYFKEWDGARSFMNLWKFVSLFPESLRNLDISENDSLLPQMMKNQKKFNRINQITKHYIETVIDKLFKRFQGESLNMSNCNIGPVALEAIGHVVCNNGFRDGLSLDLSDNSFKSSEILGFVDTTKRAKRLLKVNLEGHYLDPEEIFESLVGDSNVRYKVFED